MRNLTDFALRLEYKRVKDLGDKLVHHNTSFKFYTFAIIWHGNEEGVCS